MAASGANMSFCDFKDVVAFGNNQLWRPLAAKVKVITVGYPKQMVSLVLQKLAGFFLGIILLLNVFTNESYWINYI